MGQSSRAGRLHPGWKCPARTISLPLTCSGRNSSIIICGHSLGDLAMSVEQRLKERGITLPAVGGPLGNYVHAKRVGNLLYLSGKGPPDRADGRVPKGK